MPWLGWFLGCLLRAVQGADALLVGVLDKAQFWQRWAGTPKNARQTLALNIVLSRVVDGIEEGKLTNARWAALGKCSADTALRDINDLLARGVLRRLEGGRQSTGYELCSTSEKFVATNYSAFSLPPARQSTAKQLRMRAASNKVDQVCFGLVD